MASNTFWGIEIGAASIKAIKLESEGDGKCRVVDFAIVPHPKVLSTPGIDINDVIRVSLGQLTNQVDFGKTPIAVSIPGHSGFARFAKLPPVEPSKVGGIVEFEAKQQVPFPLDQVEWDYQTFVTPDSPEVEVGIFAVTKERVNERLQILADVGITPNIVVLSPIAVYNALSHDLDFGPKTAGTIIVDIGTTSTDLVIATPGRMWVRTFPLGGHQFTEALVNQFQLSYPKAEKLKREAQDTKHARQVFQAMRPVFTDLAQDIQRSIGYFQSLNKDAELSRLIGVGSTWRLPGLRKYLKQQLGMDVYRIETFKKIGTGGSAGEGGDDSEDGGGEKTVDPNDKNAVFNDASLSMCTAYGLALQGLGMNSVGGNLMPTAIVRKTMWKDKVKWFAMAAGVAAAAGGIMFLNPLRNYFAVGGAIKPTVLNDAVNRANEIKGEASAAGVLEAGQPDLRAANLAMLEDNRAVYNAVLADIGAMFAAAEPRKLSWVQALQEPGKPQIPVPDAPAYALDLMTTQYVGPSAAAVPGATPGSDTGPGKPWVPDDFADAPVIIVNAQFSTVMPEAKRFVNDTIFRWLRENGTRSGLAYQIVFVDQDRKGYLIQEATQTASATPPPGSELGGQGSDIRDAAPPGRGGPGRLTGGGGDTYSGIPGRGGGGETGGGTVGESGASGLQASEDINKMAYILPPKNAAKPTAYANVVWYMGFKAPKPKDDPVANDAAGKSNPGGGS